MSRKSVSISKQMIPWIAQEVINYDRIYKFEITMDM